MFVKFITEDKGEVQRIGQTFIPRVGDHIHLPDLNDIPPTVREVQDVYLEYGTDALDSKPLRASITLSEPVYT